MIKLGKISSFNKNDYTARVILEDLNNYVTGELKILKRERVAIIEEALEDTEYIHTHKIKIKRYEPKVGDIVVCAFFEKIGGDGVILGGL